MEPSFAEAMEGKALIMRLSAPLEEADLQESIDNQGFEVACPLSTCLAFM